jgi:hypothetical protein
MRDSDITKLKSRALQLAESGQPIPGCLRDALLGAMQAQQRRNLRALSNTRFGRAKARKLRQKGGELALLPNRRGHEGRGQKTPEAIR